MTIEENRENNTLVLKVKGRINTMTAPQLDEKVKNSYEGLECLVMDFSELEYISSAGLRVVLDAHKTMKGKNGKFKVRGLTNEEVREAFAITGFLDKLEVEDDEKIGIKE